METFLKIWVMLAAIGMIYFFTGFHWLVPEPATAHLSEELEKNGVDIAIIQQLVYPNISRIYLVRSNGETTKLFSFRFPRTSDIFMSNLKYAKTVPGSYRINLSPNKSFLHYSNKKSLENKFVLSDTLNMPTNSFTNFLKTLDHYELSPYVNSLNSCDSFSVSPDGKWAAFDSLPRDDESQYRNKLLRVYNWDTFDIADAHSDTDAQTIFMGSICERFWSLDSNFLLLGEYESKRYWLYQLNNTSLSPLPFEAPYSEADALIIFLGNPFEPTFIVSKHGLGEFSYAWDEQAQHFIERKLFGSNVKIIGFINE